MTAHSLSCILPVLSALCVLSAPLHAQERHPVTVADLEALREVTDPQLSPDGKWVAYVVSAVDTVRDEDDELGRRP